MQSLREHLAFVKGLAQSRNLGDGEDNECFTRELLNLIEAVIERIGHIEHRGEHASESSLRPLSMETRDCAGGPMQNAISCPSCRQRLAIGKDMLAAESFEVTCPECSLVLQVM